MAVGFRKSFLGFNCDDVINYIEATQTKFSRREAELDAQIIALKDDKESLSSKLQDVIREKEKILAKLSDFEKKCEEINQISASIGKLYLVSQTSAKNLINNSVASTQKANEEVFKNIDSIDEAHIALTDVKTKMQETAQSFMAKVDELCVSLSDTKTALVERNEDSNKVLEEFTLMFNKINNAE